MIHRDGNCLRVSGDLTIETVAAAFAADLQQHGNGGLLIDFADAGTVDSAAVSLLLSWLRRAQRDRVALSFRNIPDNLLSLARLYGVAELLPLSGEPSAQS